MIVFAPGNNQPLLQVSADGGEPTSTTSLDQQNSETSHRFPYFLPDGDHFLYEVDAGLEKSGIYLAALQSKDKKRLLDVTENAIFAPPGPPGYVLFSSVGTLMARPFDAKRLEFAGEVFPIAEQVATAGGAGAFSASGNGHLSFRTGGGGSNQLTWLDQGALIQEPGPSVVRQPAARVWLLTTAVLTGICVVLAGLYFQSRPSSIEPMHLSILAPSGTTLGFGPGPAAAVLSPDGRSVALTGRAPLLGHRVAGGSGSSLKANFNGRSTGW